MGFTRSGKSGVPSCISNFISNKNIERTEFLCEPDLTKVTPILRTVKLNKPTMDRELYFKNVFG